MITYILAFAGVFLFGIGIGVLSCLITQTITRCRRERDHARRKFQLEVEALRRDLDALRPEIDRMLQWRPGAS